jgi:hypothetical protein
VLTAELMRVIKTGYTMRILHIVSPICPIDREESSRLTLERT